MDRYQRWLWNLTKHELAEVAEFDDKEYAFRLKKNPFADEPIHPGPYRLGKEATTENVYRPGHPLAQRIINRARSHQCPIQKVIFSLSGESSRFAALNPFKGREGWLLAVLNTIQSAESTDQILLASVSDDGINMPHDIAEKLFELCAETGASNEIPYRQSEDLNNLISRESKKLEEELINKNTQILSQEIDKLDRWTDDQIASSEKELKDIKKRLRELRSEAARAESLSEQERIQSEIEDSEKRQRKLRQEIFAVEDRIVGQRKEILDKIRIKLNQATNRHVLFTIRWSIHG